MFGLIGTTRSLLLLGAILMSAVPAFATESTAAPSATHVRAVTKAQNSAYAVTDAINNCPLVSKDMHGWPAGSVQECIYSGGKLQAKAYILKVPAGTIASWIETACSQELPGAGGCFETVLKCGLLNSGLMFAVSGNILEDMDGTWENYFFRNGMTVRMSGQPNGSTSQIPLARQEELARAANDAIDSIPTGLTRYWRTTPALFAKRFPDAGVPSSLASSADQQRWLELAQQEMLGALKGSHNRLLEAYVSGGRTKLAAGKCPK